MTGKTIKDYYGILGISPDATLEEIRQAYRSKARVYHPDLNSGADAEMRFREVNEAYEVLANPQQRKMYDSFTVADTQPAAPPPEPVVTMTPPPPVAPSAASTVTSIEEPANPKRDAPPTWALLLIMIGAFIILGVVAGLLISSSQPKPSGDAAPATLVKIPTFVSPPVITEDQTVIQESGNPVLLNVPESLVIRGQRFDVVPVLPQQGRWPLPAENQKLGMWIHGTVINYVIGLPWQEETESLLAGLTSSEQLILTLDNGSRLTFGSPMVQRIATDDLSPLEQTTPGVTVVLLGGEQTERLMVQARYLPQSTDYQPVHEVDGLKVDVLKTWIMDEVSGGMLAFVIEYQISNQGTQAYDAMFFEMALEDADGRRYLPNAVVSRNGENGELTGSIEPGMVQQASVGYMIAAQSPQPLSWIFRSDVNSTDSVSLVVPFEPPAAAPALPDLQIDEIFVDESRNVIVVSGVLYNDGDGDLIVNQSDVTLTTPSGTSALQVASPFLSWTIAGGDAQDFELQFALPRNSDTAVLDIMGFAIEIDGILP